MKSSANVQARVQCAVFFSLATVALAACTGGLTPGVPGAEHMTNVRLASGSSPNWDGAYMFTEDDSSTYPLLAQTATSNTRITWPIYHRDTPIQSKVAPSQTVYYGSSLASVTSGSAQKPPYVFYDIEHWSATPISEQKDPVGSIAKAAQIAHGAGKKFGVSPDGIFMGVYRCTFVMSKSIIQQVDWSQVDELNIQAQHLASDNTCTKAGSAAFQSMVAQVASYVRSKNSNIIVSAELSMGDSSPSRLIDAANVVNGIANVIYVSYPASAGGCVYCTISNLNTVLSAL
jgi:hypothetical protein